MSDFPSRFRGRPVPIPAFTQAAVPARGVTVTEAMVERAMGVECGSTHHEHHPPDCRRCWQAKLTAALTPDAEGGRMSGIVDPSTPEREAREALRDYIVNPHKSHGQGCGVYALTRRECSCYMSAAGERRLDAYAAAVHARALADVAGWVEGMDGEFPRTARTFKDALLAKLREAK